MSPAWVPAMAIALGLALAPAVRAEEAEPLRLACRATESGGGQAFAFSIDLAAKEAIETLSGRRYGVSGARDTIVLTDGNGPAFRIDRITGFFAMETQLRLEGHCDKVERRF